LKISIIKLFVWLNNKLLTAPHFFLDYNYYYHDSEEGGKPRNKGLIRKLSGLMTTKKLTPEEKEAKAMQQRREHTDSLKLMKGEKLPGSSGTTWKPRADHPLMSAKK
jgi:hypothetical protein